MSTSKIDTVKHLLKLFETFQVDEFLTYLTDDAVYRFGNYPPAVGKEAIEATIKASHMDAIKGIAFDLAGIWEAGDTVTAELSITYTKIDDSILVLPCSDVFRLTPDGKVKSFLIYMDATPLFY